MTVSSLKESISNSIVTWIWQEGMQKKYEWFAIKAVVIIIRICFTKERIDYAPKHMNQLLA